MINKLDQNLINKIAAGEVIERPSSVVKELIENSIDAKATKIFVEIDDSGFGLIRIKDNGVGMSDEDAELSIERHATSKLKNVDDLFKIQTLGFRGEALSSISSVSNMILTTKCKDDDTAIRLKIEAGKIYDKINIGYEDGTTIEVKDLFFNVPARKKFLKNLKLEFQSIVDVITKYSLIHPDIFFKLIHNKKEILMCPISDWKGRVLDIYDSEVAKSLIEVKYEKGPYKITGFIGKPHLTRSDTSHQSLYVNNRYIKNPIISSAIYDAYHTLLFKHRHPFIILSIEIDPSLIDVNVHPTKKEIRINREAEMKDIVFTALRQTLDSENLFPENIDTQQNIFIEDVKVSAPIPRKKVEKTTQSELAFTEPKEELNVRILGKVHNCFVIIETEDGICLLDQHAADERVNYDKFMDMYMSKSIEVQQLLTPLVLNVSPQEKVLIESSLELFKELGFTIEDFGEDSFILRSLPIMLKRLQSKEIFMDMLSDINNLDKKKEAIVTSMACRGSIMKGDDLSYTQLKDLLIRLDKTKSPYTCPHGRPTKIFMTLSEIEKKFKRRT